MDTSYHKAMGFNRMDQFAQTPKEIYNLLDSEFKFNFDPCPINPKFDGLKIAWKSSNYVNPPYTEIPLWLEKALAERELGKNSVFLIPYRPHTKYFKELIQPNAKEIRFFRKRIRFNGYDNRAPFAVVAIVFDAKIKHGVSKSNFGILDIREIQGGRHVRDVFQYFSKRFKLDLISLDADKKLLQNSWSMCNFIVTRINICDFIERCELELQRGVCTILFIPLRGEAPYFLDKVMFGMAKEIWSICPNLIMENYFEASPNGSVVLIFHPKLKKLQATGPALKIYDN